MCRNWGIYALSIGSIRRLLACGTTFSLSFFISQPACGQGDGPVAPLSRFAEAKAESLLRDQLPCLGCHRLGKDGGALGPDLATVRDRRTPAYIAAIIADPDRVAPGSSMPRTVMPRKTLELLTRYLASRPSLVPSAEAAVARPALANDDRSPAALYARYCSGCHGPSGKGDGPNARSLPVPPAAHSSRDAMARRPDDSLFDTIAGGGAIMNRSARMPAFGASLSAAEIRGLVRYIRSLCRCEGPEWSTDGKKGAP